jgi:hypothetical protein
MCHLGRVEYRHEYPSIADVSNEVVFAVQFRVELGFRKFPVLVFYVQVDLILGERGEERERINKYDYK